MNNLRTNKSVLRVIFYLIVLGQIGICNAYLIITLEELLVHLPASSKSMIIDSGDQTQAPAIVHQFSVTEKVNNLLTFKILFSTNINNQNEISVIREHISEIPINKKVDGFSNKIIEVTIPRSPPQSLV